MLYNKPSYEVCMKNPLIDVKFNSLKTLDLIADIGTYCLPDGKEGKGLNEFEICEKIEALLPELIDIEELFNKYETNDKETHQVLIYL
mmetsp:Transcript_72516/g.156834  ORF Transcript_72516/g.156834 Transcript_72516/m.156834 type:complete len:88 (+) Transcript_72516:1609-1872(+)